MTYVDPTALALCIIFPFLSIVAVIARFRARTLQKVKLSADDWLVIPALRTLCMVRELIKSYPFGPLLRSAGAVKADLGQHISLDDKGFAVNGPKLVALEKMTYITPILASIALGCARWSVLMLYYRIFNTRVFRRSVYVMSALNLGWIIAFVFVFVFRCTPITEVWTSQQGQRKHCIKIQSNYAYATSSIILDVMVLSMPWPVIWKLHMPFRQKIAVTAIFMLGAIVTAAGIGKCVSFYTLGGILAKNHDLTYDEAPTFYWTVPECSLAVVCACLPTLRPIFHGLTPISLITSMRSLLSRRTFRSSNASRNATSTYESGWIDVGSYPDESRVGIARVKTDQNSTKSSATEVEMHDLERGHSALR
ncbi:Satratoxin biosynthesis SC1 cluster protein [Lachnellula willkommii]|uniref:Satratoxin biosynthesis SC1 cluster protein n=1 Tax=Lachnellula willkommii TaxID=215461 RepID=A0A559MJW2_9HELO|nr:Satratoxin biosynthesis SC1 cluster protein [Lachnellula willkommii]